MHKFSLQFKDAHLEQLYQADGQQTKYFMFQLITIQGFIFLMILLIEKLIENIEKGLLLGIIFQSYFIVSFIVVRKRQQWAEISLVIGAIILSVYQIQVGQAHEQHTFVFAQNLMASICVILFTIEFRFAMLINILTSIFRMVYASQLIDLPFRMYMLSTMIFILLTVGIYWKNHNSRIQYLLKLKDTQWEYLLPRIVNNKFYTFVLNEEQLRFELKIGSEGANQTELISFMRESKIGNKSLENFIFDKSQSFQSMVTTQIQNSYDLKIIHNGKSRMIKYYEFFVTELNFMIVIETDETALKKQQCKSTVKQQLSIFNAFISNLVNNKSSRTQNANYNIRMMKAAMFQFQCRLWLIGGKLRTASSKLSVIMNKCLQFVPKFKVQISIEDDVPIVTITPLFVLMIIELLNNSQNHNVTILLQCKKESVQMFCHGRFNKQGLYVNQTFQFALNLLLHHLEDRFDGFTFHFPQILDLSYIFVERQNRIRATQLNPNIFH